jgi:hypothetical protein
MLTNTSVQWLPLKEKQMPVTTRTVSKGYAWDGSITPVITSRASTCPRLFARPLAKCRMQYPYLSAYCVVMQYSADLYATLWLTRQKLLSKTVLGYLTYRLSHKYVCTVSTACSRNCHFLRRPTLHRFHKESSSLESILNTSSHATDITAKRTPGFCIQNDSHCWHFDDTHCDLPAVNMSGLDTCQLYPFCSQPRH